MYIKRKYQVGGVVYTPYLPAQAGSPQESTSTSGGTTSSGSSPEKLSGTMKKEIVDLLKANGLPSDVSKLLDYADEFLSKSTSLSNYSLFGGDSEDYSMSDLIRIQRLVNDVKYNDGLRNEAVKHLTSEAAGSEVAVTNRGEIYALNPEGKINKIMLSEYIDDKDKYTPLTNDELLYYREQMPGLAFDTSSLNDIQNSIGMATITKYLRDTINAFGSDKIGGYTTKDDAVNKGLEALTHAGPDGYYKFTSEEELRNVTRALRYLYNGMSNNAKNLLRAKTAVEGGDPNDPNDISKLLLQALYEHTSRTDTVDFEESATKYDPYTTGKKGGSSTSSEQLTPDTYLYRVASLNGPRQTVMIAPRGAKINDTGLLVTMGIVNGAVVDGDDKRLGPMSLTHMLQSAEAVKAADASTITLGNRRLKDSEYGAVMFDGNTECNTVFLPYTTDNGRIVPDFDVFRKFNELQNRISGKFNVPKTEIDRIANEIGLDSDAYNYDSTTNSCTLKNTMAFLSFGVIVGDDSIDLTKDDKRFLEKIDRSEAKSYEKAYNNMLVYGKADRKRSDLKVGNYKKSGANDFYRGLI